MKKAYIEERLGKWCTLNMLIRLLRGSEQKIARSLWKRIGKGLSGLMSHVFTLEMIGAPYESSRHQMKNTMRTA